MLTLVNTHTQEVQTLYNKNWQNSELVANFKSQQLKVELQIINMNQSE